MIKVNQTAKTLDEGIKNLMSGAKQDYVRMSTSNGTKELTGYSKDQVEKWDSNTKVSQGKKYIKVVQDTGVFCFIIPIINLFFRITSKFFSTRGRHSYIVLFSTSHQVLNSFV